MPVLTPAPTPTATPFVASGPDADTGAPAAGSRVADRSAVGVTPRRVLAAEWLKFRSVRSNLTTLASAAAATVGFGMLFSAFAGSGDQVGPNRAGADALAMSLGGVNLAQIFVAVLGVMFVTSEYGSGLIRTMFTAVPTRLPVLGAKAAVVAVATTVVMTVASFAAFLGGQAVYGVPEAAMSLGDDGVIRALFGTGLYLGGIAAMGVALGFLLRSAGSAIGMVIGTLMVAPLLVRLLPSSFSDPVSRILPSTAGEAFRSVATSSDLLSPAAGAAVFTVWVVGLVGAAALAVRRRDA